MQPSCTCGALLPDDARFCHKCGKPQFEEDVVRLNELESNSGPAQAPLQPPLESGLPLSGISFKNSRAVMISLLVAMGAMIGFLPVALIAAQLFPVFLCGVGFIAVRIYKGRSKEQLTTSAGARLGWMTGLWIFLVTAVLLAMTAIVVSSPGGWEQLRATWSRLPQGATFQNLTQHDFLVQMLLMLPFSFILLTLLPGLGGMLGAKFPLRRRSS